MILVPVDSNWAERQFPAVFRVFGQADLHRQIEVFNEFARRREYRSWDSPLLLGALRKAKLRAPHVRILNSLSGLQDSKQPAPGATGWIVRLEFLLKDAFDAGLDATMFAEMLRSSPSFFDLIAELEWGTVLRSLGGQFTPHSPKPGTNRNFDLDWRRNFRLLGDVKFFQSWFVHSSGEDSLSTKLELLDNDLAHDLIVGSRQRELGQNMAVDAAIEVIALYEMGLADKVCGQADIEKIDGDTLVRNHNPNSLVQWVRFSVNRQRQPGRISVIESDLEGDDDFARIRRNILDAAGQIPRPGNGEIACPFLGSFSPTDAESVAEVTLGPWEYDRGACRAVRRGGGALDEKNAMPDFEHLDAVIHFAIWLEPNAGDLYVANVKRTCELFEKNARLDGDKRAFLDEALSAFRRTEAVRVVHREP